MTWASGDALTSTNLNNQVFGYSQLPIGGGTWLGGNLLFTGGRLTVGALTDAVGQFPNGTTAFESKLTPTDPTVRNHLVSLQHTISAGATAITASQRGYWLEFALEGSGGGSSNAVGYYQQLNNNQTAGTLALTVGANIIFNQSGGGTTTDYHGVRSITNVSGTGNITTGIDFLARTPIRASTGVIVTKVGFKAENQGLAGTTLSVALDIDAQSGSATNYAIRTAAGLVDFGGLVAALAGLTIASGQTLTLTGTTVEGTPTWSSNQAITLSTAAQANVTSLGTLTALTIAGNLTFSGASRNIIAGTTNFSLRNNANNADNILVTDAGAITLRSTVGGITTLTATTLAGTLSTAAQTNITSVGTLTGLTVNGTAIFQVSSTEVARFISASGAILQLGINGSGEVGTIHYNPTTATLYLNADHGSVSPSIEAIELLKTQPSDSGTAYFRLPHGTAPSAPVNGDVWTTTAGLFVRVNGSTVGPLS